MEIEVGEYVRLKNGLIGKIIDCMYAEDERRTLRYIEPNHKLIRYQHNKYWLDNKRGRITDINIVKHSKNIIDLIEEGDYVNGYYIYEIREVGEWKWLEIEADLLSNRIEENEIKTIVTKEQFNANCYKVKE